MRVWKSVSILALGIAGVVVVSRLPYRPLPGNEALLLVNFAHPSRPEGACRTRTEAEVAALPPNLRAPEVCPRRRIAVPVRIELDGLTVMDETLFPAGLQRDGSASVHRRIPVAGGRHAIRIRMLDEERAADVELAPGQVLRIDYRPERGGVVIL